MRVDVSGDTNLETQAVGGGAVSESFLSSSTGALFTANSLSDSVSEFIDHHDQLGDYDHQRAARLQADRGDHGRAGLHVTR